MELLFTLFAVAFAFGVGYMWGAGKLSTVWAWTSVAAAGAATQAEPIVDVITTVQ